MKKLLLFLLIIFVFTSCTVDTFTSDPSLKESERMAVLQKAKTDTLTVLITVDKSAYTVKNGEITSKADLENNDSKLFWIGMLAGEIIILLFIGWISDRY